MEDALYMSPMGPIAPLDIVFGHRASLAGGNLFMAHRTGFTASTLAAALIKAGFAAVMMQRSPSAFNLDAVAFRTMPTDEQMTHAQRRCCPPPIEPPCFIRRRTDTSGICTSDVIGDRERDVRAATALCSHAMPVARRMEDAQRTSLPVR